MDFDNSKDSSEGCALNSCGSSQGSCPYFFGFDVMLSTVIKFSSLVKNAGGPSKVDSRFLPLWYGFFATLPLVTTLSLIIFIFWEFVLLNLDYDY